MLDKVIFYFFAGIAVAGGVLTVTRRNAVHSAIFLVTSLLATAGIFLQLRAEFLFIVQIILYVGGIMVLFVFVIMLLNAGVEEHTSISKMAGAPGLLLVVALGGLVAATIVRSTDSILSTMQTGEMSSSLGVSKTLGISNMIFKDFVYPFELTSFLILVAVLGATVLAQREKS